MTYTGLHGTTTDEPNGEACTVTTTIVELPHTVIQSFQTLIASNQAQIQVNNMIIQNGLTTNQVIKKEKLLLRTLYIPVPLRL